MEGEARQGPAGGPHGGGDGGGGDGVVAVAGGRAVRAVRAVGGRAPRLPLTHRPWHSQLDARHASLSRGGQEPLKSTLSAVAATVRRLGHGGVRPLKVADCRTLAAECAAVPAY